MRPNRLSLLFFSLVLLFSCKNEAIKQTNEQPTHQVTESTLKYARRFSIIEENGFKKVLVFGNRNSWDTTATLVKE